MVDAFIFLDDVPYSKGDWRNRNLIKTRHGLKWLTIPLNDKTKINIRDILTVHNNWSELHWKQITHNYQKSRFFKQYGEQFEQLYREPGNKLSSINRKFIETINEMLGISTPISWSYEHTSATGKNERLIEICQSCGANTYLSGPAAKNYVDEALFAQHGIGVEWMDYSGYPEYKQLFPPFEHGVTILDLLFNEGPDSKKFMKSFLL
jgi:WbqC-like protein family